jgi:hypothetical protein
MAITLELKSSDGEAPSAVVTGPAALALAAAVEEWARRGGSYEDVLDALTPKERGPLSDAAVLQARRNAQARSELLDEFGALTSAEVADAAGSRAGNRASLASRWRDEGRVFAVRVGDGQLYPAFQLGDDGRPLDAIREALAQLRPAGLSDWQLALWFTTPTGWLGGRRPVDLLDEEPAAVAAAAEREVGELVA